MGTIGDEWDRSIHAIQCEKYAEEREKVWDRFKRLYKHKHGVDWVNPLKRV